jgi:hypothetical protein
MDAVFVSKEHLDQISFNEIRNLAYEILSGVSARELAGYFKIGNEGQRMLYRDFLSTKAKKFREKFRKHLEDSLREEPSNN